MESVASIFGMVLCSIHNYKHYISTVFVGICRVLVIEKKKKEMIMMAEYYSVNVKCPFYKGEKGVKLICEGLDKECNIHHQYQEKERKRERVERYCSDRYTECELYRALERKYEK